MDGLSILFGILTTLFIVLVIGVNTFHALDPVKKEGFEDGKESAPASQIPLQIQTILDPMAKHGPELCALFDKVRANMAKNEAAGQNLPAEEISRRVEKALAVAIPGGALPCSPALLQYPKPGSTDLEWLDFLQKVPVDFGARVVLMALYARNTLVKTQINLEGQLARLKNKDIKLKISKALGIAPEPLTEEEKQQDEASEGFAPLCPPTVADTRRAEKAAKAQQACTLPEDLSPKEIQESVTSLLKQLVAKRTLLLKEKGVDPNIDLAPILKQAKDAAGILDMKGKQAEAGTLMPTALPS